MESKTENAMTLREWIHRLVDVVDDGDLDAVKWLVQPYAARALNKRYREEQTHEEAQDTGCTPAGA